MIKRDKVITEESLEIVALIKYQFAKIIELNESTGLLDKEERKEELEGTETNTAKLLAVFQLMNSDLSYSKSIELLCEWINSNELLVKSVEKMFKERTYFAISDGLNSDSLKDIKDVHNEIINSMGITFKKEMLNSLIEKAKKAEEED